MFVVLHHFPLIPFGLSQFLLPDTSFRPIVQFDPEPNRIFLPVSLAQQDFLHLLLAQTCLSFYLIPKEGDLCPAGREGVIGTNGVQVVLVKRGRQGVCAGPEGLLGVGAVFAGRGRQLCEFELEDDARAVGHVFLGLPSGLTFGVTLPFDEILVHATPHSLLEDGLNLVDLTTRIFLGVGRLESGDISLDHAIGLGPHGDPVLIMTVPHIW